MTLSAPAKKLLSEQPELVKEIATSFTVQVVQAIDVPKNHWGEFVEKNKPSKDWEILEFRMISDNALGFHVSTLRSNGKYLNGIDGHAGVYELSEVLKNKDWKIHSVKRLSDGEVFTIGDTIDLGTIESFVFDKEFSTGLVAICTNTNKSSIDSARKDKQSLFTTHDGKPVFEGERMWLCSTKAWTIIDVAACKEPFTDGDKFKYFSTKEKAEQYIFDNKPIFSLKEATQFIDRNRDIETIEKYVELAKQKT